jgi:hypothetical protein
MLICSNCGGTQFGVFEVLWPELSAAWQLSAQEIAYVNDQQGRHCKSCGANLRAMALGDALRRVFGTERCVREYVGTPPDRPPRILDVNGIPAVSDSLARLAGYVRADYPTVDLHRLPYAAGSFDLIVHSDTLDAGRASLLHDSRHRRPSVEVTRGARGQSPWLTRYGGGRFSRPHGVRGGCLDVSIAGRIRGCLRRPDRLPVSIGIHLPGAGDQAPACGSDVPASECGTCGCLRPGRSAQHSQP